MKPEYKYPQGTFWVMRSWLGCAELLERHGQNERALKLYRKLAEKKGKEADYARGKIQLLKQE